MFGVLVKRHVIGFTARRARHILKGQQSDTWKLSNNNEQSEEVQRRAIELEKITQRSVVHGHERKWYATADYMKTNKAHEVLYKTLTACAVILVIDIILFILAGKDLKRRRLKNMKEREMQRKNLNLLGEERHKIGKPFVVS